MSHKNIRPKWWQLYLTFPLLVILFAVDSRLKISARGHQVVQIGTVIFVFELIHLWLKTNSTALSKIDREQYGGTFRMIEIPPNQTMKMNRGDRPIFHLGDSEIKGVLDNTFEMDYISAEASPIEKVPQELNKE